MTEKLSWWVEIRTPAHKKQEEIKKPEATRTNPKAEAFGICSRVFKDDPINRIQNIEECFSIASQTPEATDFFTIITTLPEEELKNYFDAKKWIPFKDVCTNEEVVIFCTQFEKYKTALEAQNKSLEAQNKSLEAQNKSLEAQNKEKNFKELFEKLQKHPDLFKKYGEDLNKFKDDTQSPKFQEAMKGLLTELKTQAKTPESFAEYTSFVEQFHSIGAVSEVEYAVLKREMEELSKGLSSKSIENGGNSPDYKLPEGFRESQDTRGVYTKYASVGESFDQVVTIRDGKGSKDIISPTSGYSVHLDNAVSLEEYSFIQQEANFRAELENTTQTYTDILAKNDEFIAKEEKREGKNEKDIATLEEAKKFKQEKTEELAKKKQEIEMKLAKLAQEKTQRATVGGDIETREKQAHDTIRFIDDMGLYALGVENVKVFLDTIREKAIGLKLDPTKGFSNTEKRFIKEEFTSLIGTDIFNTEPNFTRRADMQEIGSVKQKIAENSNGKFDPSKIPPITSEGLKLLIGRGK